MATTLRPLLILLTLLAYFLHINADENEDSYEYISDDEANEEAIAKEDEGVRLVGARTSRASAVPFIVGLDLRGSGDGTTCTGSLIAPKWIISAAHCTALISEWEPHEKEKCLNSGSGQSGRQTFNCKTLEDGSMEYSNIEPEGNLWVGLTSIAKINEAETHKLKRIIRPKDVYFGGARYGTNGGYDISLLEMKEDTRRPPACLPSPMFNDNVQSKLAGYGRFLRDNGQTCQTDEQGKMKYHYCEQTGQAHKVCKKRAPPQSRRCKKFFEENRNIGTQYNDIHSDENMTPEIILVEPTGKLRATCHVITETNEKHGWCRTMGSYYNFDHPKENVKGWGFCGKDCYLEKRVQKEGGAGTLRVVDKVDVLEDDLCNKYLEKSLDEGEPKTRPEILCVGYIKKFHTEAYTVDGKPYNGSVRHYGDYHGEGFYITSAGTCNGDSGGPLYIQQSRNKFVVTGAVSGGRGILGRCGGINNPVHYARVKKFTKWIGTIVGNADDFCWDQDFENKLNSL